MQLEPDRGTLILAGLAAAAFGTGDAGMFLFEHLFGAGHVAQAIAFAKMRGAPVPTKMASYPFPSMSFILETYVWNWVWMPRLST